MYKMSFDLNIGNYSLGELIDIFELPPNYTIMQLETNLGKMRDNINHDTSLSREVRSKTIEFINEAKITFIFFR